MSCKECSDILYLLYANTRLATIVKLVSSHSPLPFRGYLQWDDERSVVAPQEGLVGLRGLVKSDSAAVAESSDVCSCCFGVSVAKVMKNLVVVTIILCEAMIYCPKWLGLAAAAVVLMDSLVPKASKNPVAENSLLCVPSIPVNSSV